MENYITRESMDMIVAEIVRTIDNDNLNKQFKMTEIERILVDNGLATVIEENEKIDEKLQEKQEEYEKFIKTRKGKKWAKQWKEITHSDIAGDFGDYLYDFYSEMLM